MYYIIKKDNVKKYLTKKERNALNKILKKIENGRVEDFEKEEKMKTNQK